MYREVPGEFDDIFVLENVVLILEYTTAQSTGLSEHLKSKKVLYDKILEDRSFFMAWLKGQLKSDQAGYLGPYDNAHFKVFILYCSKSKVDSTLKSSVNNVLYFDFGHVKYFKLVAEALRRSARFEFMNFLGLQHSDFGSAVISISMSQQKSYDGALLPEFHSKFGPGIKVLSFYAEPDALLSRAYVLRKEGWIEHRKTYQRLVDKKKVASVRRHLIDKKHVFVNNIIVSLPPKTRVINDNAMTVDIGEISKTQLVRVQLPEEFNSIAIIDGQHRVYAYHEGGVNDDQIAPLRQHQNLLVTGIVYPEAMGASERVRFEAELFLHLNATQTSASSKVRQEIGLLLRPFSSEAIARRVVARLNEVGPLADSFEMRFYEKGKLKVPSIVSFGIQYLVRPTSEHGFFKRWNDADKDRLISQQDETVLERYVEYSVKELNLFLGAVRSRVGSARWTLDKIVKNRVLTTTAVNGFIHCLREVADSGHQMGSFEFYSSRLVHITSVDISSYKSSQYAALGRDLFVRCFESK